MESHMSRSGDELLRSLKRRRSGADRLELLDEEGRRAALSRNLSAEPYEGKTSGKYTQYALGAMEAVDPSYTRISVETATRVQNQLKDRLDNAGLESTFRLQGSVPLDIHIRGVSDVDLLVIGLQSLLYANSGARALRGEYSPAVIDTTDLVRRIRRSCETSLPLAFPAATIDASGAKAVKISGGSLPRAVDVVPAVWWDTAGYQQSGNEVDRGVSVYDKYADTTVNNLPFLHIRKITDKCNETYGSLRKAIRLCKNLKADRLEDGLDIDLSSYEIAGLLYYADKQELIRGAVYELGILAEAQRFMDYLWNNKDEARRLVTPDGSRMILDSQQKVDAILFLSAALDELLANVAREQSAAIRSMERTSFSENREAVRSLLF